MFKKIKDLAYRIIMERFLFKIMDSLFGKQVDALLKKEKEKSLSVVKHFQESEIEKIICDGICGNVDIQLKDGSWYIFKPLAKRAPNSTHWIRLWEER